MRTNPNSTATKPRVEYIRRSNKKCLNRQKIIMKKTSIYLKHNFFACLLIATLLAVPLESCAINTANTERSKTENSEIENGEVLDLQQTENNQKSKKKKDKGKVKQKKMNKKLVAVPESIWGANGIILNVEENGVTIQYECADGVIEDSLKVNEQNAFEANGFHIRQRGGPIRVDAKLARQPAFYEGKISGNTMTLKVTLIETKEVIGEFILERGKTPRMTRCY